MYYKLEISRTNKEHSLLFLVTWWLKLISKMVNHRRAKTHTYVVLAKNNVLMRTPAYLLSISKKEKEQKNPGKNCVVPVLIIEVKLDRKAVVWAKFYGVMTI